jgi:hypothetical protein
MCDDGQSLIRKKLKNLEGIIIIIIIITITR